MASSISLSASKSLLRTRIDAAIKAIPIEERIRQSDLIQNWLLQSEVFQHSSRISIYLSLSKEVSTNSIVSVILGGMR